MYSRVRFSGWRLKLSGPRGGAAAAGALAAVLAVLVGLGVAGVFPAGSAGARAAAAGAVSPARVAGSPGVAAARSPGVAAAGAAGSGHGRRAAPARAVAGQPRTSCRRVAHIGDSTSVGLVSPLDLPDPAQRLAAQYRDVGVRHTWIDASGGRSMVEEMPGQINGYDTARTMVSEGFRGCWVIALGTNDTANVSVGSNVGRMARIEELMSVAHGAPVMWVNVKTLDPSGPWSEANMRLWNDTLRPGLPPVSEPAGLRLGLGRPGWLVHLGRDPLHPGRLRGPGPPDRPGAGPGVPRLRPQCRLRHPLTAHQSPRGTPGPSGAPGTHPARTDGLPSGCPLTPPFRGHVRQWPDIPHRP